MAMINDEIVFREKSANDPLFVKLFIRSAGAILTLTGIAKIWGAFGSARLLNTPDPLLGIPFGHLMLAVGILELLIAGICLFSRAQKLSLALVAWLSTNFVVYRVGLWWIGYHKPCSCLGNLTDALHISPHTADTAMKIVLACLLIGSYGGLLLSRCPRGSTHPMKFGKCLCIVMFIFFSSRVPGQSAPLCSDFEKLINGNTPIRYFKIGFSNIFRANQQAIPGWVFYEGAIQRDTFWIRNCTNSPSDPAIMMPGWLVGMSHSNYWSYSNDKVTISPRPAAVKSPVEDRAEQALAMVRQAFGLGVQVASGSLKLEPDYSFRADVVRGTNLVPITGHFDVLSGGRPSRCDYKSSGWSNGRMAVSYAYPEGIASNCLPATIKVEAFNSSQQIDCVQYWIITCEFGEASPPNSGYTIDSLTNLGGINLWLRDILGTVVFRDGAIYSMDKTGKQTLVSRNWGAPTPATIQTRGKIVQMAIISIIVLSALPLLWFIARYYRSISNKSASTK